MLHGGAKFFPNGGSHRPKGDFALGSLYLMSQDDGRFGSMEMDIASTDAHRDLAFRLPHLILGGDWSHHVVHWIPRGPHSEPCHRPRLGRFRHSEDQASTKRSAPQVRSADWDRRQKSMPIVICSHRRVSRLVLGYFQNATKSDPVCLGRRSIKKPPGSL